MDVSYLPKIPDIPDPITWLDAMSQRGGDDARGYSFLHDGLVAVQQNVNLTVRRCMLNFAYSATPIWWFDTKSVVQRQLQECRQGEYEGMESARKFLKMPSLSEKEKKALRQRWAKEDRSGSQSDKDKLKSSNADLVVCGDAPPRLGGESGYALRAYPNIVKRGTLLLVICSECITIIIYNA